MSALRCSIPSDVCACACSGAATRRLAPVAIALALVSPWCTPVDAAPRPSAETTARPGVWTELPTPATTGVVVFDSQRVRWLLLGVPAPGSGVVVWTLDANDPFGWMPLATVGIAPENLVWAEYDDELDRVLMASAGFGIYALSLANSAWSDRLAGGGVHHGMHAGATTIHDRAHNRLLVYGGASRYFTGAGETRPEKNELCYLGQLWSVPLDGTPVQRLQPLGTIGVRGSAPIALDVAGDRLLVFGGRTGCEEIWEQPAVVGTWELTLSEPMQWRELPTAPDAPSFEAGFPTVIQKDGSILLFAGPRRLWRGLIGDDVRWQPLGADTTGPPDRAGCSIGVDPDGVRALFHGGSTPFETWTMSRGDPTSWRGFGWDTPPERWGQVLVADPDRNRILMFGGRNSAGLLKDTWQLPMDARGGWSPVLATGARPHAGAAGALDPVTRRLMVFGGLDGMASSSLFVLDLESNEWGPVLLSPVPPARMDPAVAWDPKTRRMFVIGGVGRNGLGRTGGALTDVWAIRSDGTCADLTPLAGGPEPRAGATAVYDSRANRVLLVGGDNGRETTEVWSLSLAPNVAWTRLYAGTDVGPLRGRCAGYDASMNRVLVFGGKPTDTGVVSELLAFRLDHDSGNPWEVLTAEHDRQPPVMGTMVMDPVSPRAVVYGGSMPPEYGFPPIPSSSTWAYSWTPDIVTAIAVSLVSAGAEVGRARLEWSTHAGSSAEAWVERRTEREDWRRIGSAPDLGGGRRVFEDATVATGARYAYRLRVAAPAEREVLSEATWLEIPNALHLSIAAGGAQPSGARPRLAVTLPAPGHARVDVLDASGRRVFAHELYGAQAGRIFLGVDKPLAAGVYLARVTFGTERRATKLVVVP